MKVELIKRGVVALCFISLLFFAGCAAETDEAAHLPGNGVDVPQESAEIVPDEDGAFTQGDYKFKINDDDSVTITKYLGSGGNVIIPAKLDGKLVTHLVSTYRKFIPIANLYIFTRYCIQWGSNLPLNV